ncbi:hypothetical protein [Streptomyces sp. Ru62]|uniref:hypothetical protein n=1 Tax=Streptomyces sp. Ru62 TaxID=2080745 RepID=UPI0015E468E6|nr:hypothetical protein [Streptomyces sp. Ru62]
MDAVVAISLLRMAAADLTMEPWQRSPDACLVQLGLDSLSAGIEAPSLPPLAGRALGEYPQARELFDLLLEELGLLPLTWEDPAKARWAAAHWWARQIAARRLDPVHGAKLIHAEAAAELDRPARAAAHRRPGESARPAERSTSGPAARARPGHLRGAGLSAAEAHRDHGL